MSTLSVTLPRERGTKMLLSTARARFLDDLRAWNKARATITAYGSDITRFIAALPIDSVARFTPEAVAGYFRSISTAEMMPNTLCRKVRALRQFAKWGMKRGLWSKDPMALVEPMKAQRGVPRPFSDAEMQALMALPLDPREALVRCVLAYTGIRVTPLTTIKVGDVSFMPPTIRAIVKGSKTQVFKMHPRLVTEMQSFIRDHTDGRAHTLIFALAGRVNPSRKRIEEMTQRWGRAAGVPDCTPHRFRHTFATRLLQTTQNMRLVQNAMGHESIATTQVYALVTNEEEAHGISRLSF
jgi:integrase/recombinase XerD